MGVMVGMGEGGRSQFYILQLPINRPMAVLLVVVVVAEAVGPCRAQNKGSCAFRVPEHVKSVELSAISP